MAVNLWICSHNDAYALTDICQVMGLAVIVMLMILLTLLSRTGLMNNICCPQLKTLKNFIGVMLNKSVHKCYNYIDIKLAKQIR